MTPGLTRDLAVALVVVPLALAAPLRAAAPQGAAVPADVQAAQALLVLAYPELFERPVTFRFVAAQGGLQVQVAEAVNALSAPTGEARPVLVEAVVEFAPDGQLARFHAEGTLVASAPRRALAVALKAHPHWTDADREARLLALGAKHPPAGRFDVPLDLARWARFLGADPRPASTVFDWGGNGPPSDRPAGPRWVASLTATAAGRHVRYRLEFEPVGGRLVAITRQ